MKISAFNRSCERKQSHIYSSRSLKKVAISFDHDPILFSTANPADEVFGRHKAAKAEGDEKTGLEILRRALSAPTRQIAENSAVDGGVVVARMLESKGNMGYDAAQNEYVDLVEAGIVDPTKVVRVATEPDDLPMSGLFVQS
jgi:hypothetical protein